MNRTSHTLWLGHAPGPVLKMASNGDDSLDAKLRNEIAAVEQQRQGKEGAEADLLAAEAQCAQPADAVNGGGTLARGARVRGAQQSRHRRVQRGRERPDGLWDAVRQGRPGRRTPVARRRGQCGGED